MKIGLGFVFFFVLFYVEPLPIGSVPFAVLWKALLFAVLLIGLYISPRGRALPAGNGPW